ncbi:S8 family serine peptidase [Amycolatopsis keratiniphila]|uniref:Peptidase S8 n=1 Tax=Amycolatopsis keratiniphila subsp. keratiniphila TaxID=227715 RepID=A0A1W2M3V3_9PSEU|nr:S8 family serine peptidase [Amycolatopsis keratiniphila]ONF74369.1 peptidase S8 [Amycolatopsis keratiniphila subsp. keratiniphila]
MSLWTTSARAIGCAVAVMGSLCALSVPASSSPSATIVNADSPDAVPGRYIVVLKGSAAASSTASATAMTQRYGGQLRHVYDAVVGGYSAAMSAQQATRLAADPAVQSVRQVQEMVALDTQPNPANWGLDRIDQPSLPLNGSYTYPSNGGQGVNIYVMDSGINAAHTDFTGRIGAGYDFVDGDSTPQDCHGHGTHVAGSAAGSRYGVAKKATIVPLRVLNCSGSAYDDDLIAAANWVTRNATKPAVLNYSIGCRSQCPSNPPLESAVRSVIASGVQWVMAAGNSNDDACQYSPQHIRDGVTVGNSTRTDARRSDSNYGTCLDIWGPGTDIVSASHTSNTGTTTMSGTSMASPHVAGVAALHLAQNPTATPAQVRDALVNNASVGKLTGVNGSPNVLLNSAYLNGQQPGEVSVANPGDQTATAGQAFRVDNSASGGTSPYTWSATGLPSGLSIDSASGSITGTPTTVGTANVTVTARDSAGRTGSASFRVVVGSTGGECQAITNSTVGRITDFSTTRSVITSTCSGTASASATVAVNITHPYIGDLRVTLIAPDGSSYLLHNRTGGDTDDLIKTYTVNLAAESRAGQWTLSVYDGGPQDTGTLNRWTLTL